MGGVLRARWITRSIVGGIAATLLLELAPPAPGHAAQAAGEGAVEAISLLGAPLMRPRLPEDFRIEQTAHLKAAETALTESPGDPEALIWVGRRTAYLGRYREAIDIFSRGIESYPDHAPLYRHRGHRYISIRRFDDAIEDLSQAADLIAGKTDIVEQDGLPNALGIPTGTLQSNIWYHLGLAHYLQGDFESALAAYRACLEVSGNPDMLSATTYWLYMTLRRLGREEEAATVLEPISAEMEIIENHEYHRLLLVFAGERIPESSGTDDSLSSATSGYGIGNWHLINGRNEAARRVFERIVAGTQWAAFGYIAAEAELARNDT